MTPDQRADLIASFERSPRPWKRAMAGRMRLRDGNGEAAVVRCAIEEAGRRLARAISAQATAMGGLASVFRITR